MAKDMLVIVPSRGRLENLRRLLDAWQETSSGLADLMVAVDADDPEIDAYDALTDHGPRFDWTMAVLEERLRLGGTLNALAVPAAQDYRAVGFMGDDVVPRTPNWDARLLAALDDLGSGIAYGNDMIQGERLPTAVFMTSDIIRTLGWMAVPTLVHLFTDNAWKALGEGMGRLRYLPDVILEHLHPLAEKAPWDDVYEDANSQERESGDRTRFEAWQRDGLPLDLAKLGAAGLCS